MITEIKTIIRQEIKGRDIFKIKKTNKIVDSCPKIAIHLIKIKLLNNIFSFKF